MTKEELSCLCPLPLRLIDLSTVALLKESHIQFFAVNWRENWSSFCVVSSTNNVQSAQSDVPHDEAACQHQQKTWTGECVWLSHCSQDPSTPSAEVFKAVWFLVSKGELTEAPSLHEVLKKYSLKSWSCTDLIPFVVLRNGTILETEYPLYVSTCLLPVSKEIF